MANTKEMLRQVILIYSRVIHNIIEDHLILPGYALQFDLRGGQTITAWHFFRVDADFVEVEQANGDRRSCTIAFEAIDAVSLIATNLPNQQLILSKDALRVININL